MGQSRKLLCVVYFSFVIWFSSPCRILADAKEPVLTANVATVPFEDGYMPLFGNDNVKASEDGNSVRLLLDRNTGSGIISQDLYMYGFFSASIKLPADYTAGVVAAFYTSNADMFEKHHDELDFEFLGNIRGKEWRIQTNVYGNGSTAIGREERYTLWFDPTLDFHQYSILWNHRHIVFFVDDVPIRQLVKIDSMGYQYPSKPMSVYSTIWDGSAWATAGGRYKVNYRYGPFAVTLSNLILEGCAVDPIEQSPLCTADIVSDPSALDDRHREALPNLSELSAEQKSALDWFRRKHVTYSYCEDRVRYPSPLPECPPRGSEANPRASADVKFGSHHHQRHRRKRPTRTNKVHTSTLTG